MTVKELIEHLQKFDPALQVKLYDYPTGDPITLHTANCGEVNSPDRGVYVELS